MFYKFVIASMLFCLSCMASNDIKDLDSFRANFVQNITSNSTNKKLNMWVKFYQKKWKNFMEI